MSNIRTDLAVEARELYQGGSGREIPGVRVDVETPYEDINVTRVTIFSDAGERAMGKPQGSYITVESSSPFCASEQLLSFLFPLNDHVLQWLHVGCRGCQTGRIQQPMK